MVNRPLYDLARITCKNGPSRSLQVGSIRWEDSLGAVHDQGGSTCRMRSRWSGSPYVPSDMSTAERVLRGAVATRYCAYGQQIEIAGRMWYSNPFALCRWLRTS